MQLRTLFRTPAFALTALVTLALGTGLSTAVFTVANTVFLRSLPVQNQNDLVVLWGDLQNKNFNYPLALATAKDFAHNPRSLSGEAFVAYEGAQPQPITEAGATRRLRRSLVSGNFFSVLQVKPALGRTLQADDDEPGAAPSIILSYKSWQQQFAADSSILTKKIVMFENNVAYQIVGVMPQGLDYPRGTDFWAPLIPTLSQARLPLREVFILGRLAPRATPAAAQQELTAFFQRPESSPYVRTMTAEVHTLPSLVLGDTKPAMIVFAIASALLLLITCINVANLLLVRGLARTREFAVRAALGASRARIVRQLLGENAILAALGGALGVGVAYIAIKSFVAFAPPGVPRLDEIKFDTTSLLGAGLITLLTLPLVTLPGTLHALRVTFSSLREGSRQTATRRSRRATELLVAGQIAIAVLVLSAAGLITKSFIELERVNLAMDPSHVLIGELALQSDAFNDKAKQAAMLERVSSALSAVPGVRAMSPVVATPFSTGWTGGPAKEGQSPEEAASNGLLNMELVGTGYFAALGVPVLRGRVFTDADRDGSLPVTILSESAAQRYWPGENPIGKRLGFNVMLTVVGIVPDTRYRDLREAWPSIYIPLRQTSFAFAPTTFVIRTAGPPAELVPAIRRAIGESGAGVTLASAAPFASFTNGPLAQPRLNAFLLIVFAVAALALAAVGLFGVMATMVRQRTRELGVRMALGATASNVRYLVMGRGLAIAFVGTGVGLIGAVVGNRLLVSLLYNVSPTDGFTLGGVAVLLMIVAAVASFVPARAGTRIDPALVMRAEG